MPEHDAELVRQTLAGKPDAYGELIERHADFVHGIVYGRLGHREDALELVQAVFVRAYERLATLREPERFRNWLSLIASTQAKNRLRDRRDVVTDRIPDRAAEGDGPLEGLIGSEERRRVRDALAGLPEKNRAVLVLRYQSGLGYEEIAANLGIPATTVRSRIYEGKKMLRERLDAPTEKARTTGRRP